MRYETIIIDFDGTIADTRKSIIKTVKETLKTLGFPLFEEKKIGDLIGLPLDIIFQKVANLNGSNLDKTIKEYRLKYYKIALSTITLFPGVENTLKKLHNKKINLVIASNRDKTILNKLLNYLKIFNFFSFIVGEQDVKNKKPAPDAVNFILEKLSISHNKTLVVGDTIYDIEMGKNAKCDTCAVTYGNNSINQLETVFPNFIIDKFSQLLNII